MPTDDELGREYTKQEARIWREVKFSMKSQYGSLRLSRVEGTGSMSKPQIGQMGRTWQNDGLCVTSEAGRVVITLTEFGRKFEFGDNGDSLY